jgi:beta-N-acetylglucosaminidase
MKGIIIITIAILLTVCFLSYLMVCTPRPQTAVNTPQTATQLAQTITVLRPSFMEAKYLDDFTKGTPLQGHGYDFIKAEELSGIGADYLLAIAIHESGWGTNYYSKVYHQIFSWGVWDRGPTSEAYYSSITGCLVGEYQVINGSKVWKDGVPVKMKKLYLTKGASYYSGETLSAINKYYASDKSWADAVIDIHSKIVENLPEDIRAKQWVMGSKIMNGNLPSPTYYTTDYWTKPITREELAVILWRIQNK